MLKRRSTFTGRPTGGSTAVDLEAKLFRGLGDPARLTLLRELAAGPKSAGALATSLGLTPSNASNHLRCLLECGLVAVESEGRFNLYRLSMPSIPRLLDAAAEVLSVAGPAIEKCLAYGPPSRRVLRVGSRSAPFLVALKTT